MHANLSWLLKNLHKESGNATVHALHPHTSSKRLHCMMHARIDATEWKLLCSIQNYHHFQLQRNSADREQNDATEIYFILILLFPFSSLAL